MRGTVYLALPNEKYCAKAKNLNQNLVNKSTFITQKNKLYEDKQEKDFVKQKPTNRRSGISQ